MMKPLLILLLIPFVTVSTLACSCIQLPKISNEEIKNAKNIFIGVVLKVEEVDNRSRKVTLQIIESFKTDSINQITILTGIGGADCGLYFSVGQKWYVFAHNSGNEVWASLCGRSALLSKKKYNKHAYRRAKQEINYILHFNRKSSSYN
jgi:hypothetical protein